MGNEISNSQMNEIRKYAQESGYPKEYCKWYGHAFGYTKVGKFRRCRTCDTVQKRNSSGKYESVGK